MRKIVYGILTGVLILIIAVAAHAEVPTPILGTNLSGSIATTNTFQLIQTITNDRVDCTIQNNSASNSMWVYFGLIASASKASSAILAPGQTLSCRAAGGNFVLKNHVSITGTSGDAFYANFQ